MIYELNDRLDHRLPCDAQVCVKCYHVKTGIFHDTHYIASIIY